MKLQELFETAQAVNAFKKVLLKHGAVPGKRPDGRNSQKDWQIPTKAAVAIWDNECDVYTGGLKNLQQHKCSSPEELDKLLSSL